MCNKAVTHTELFALSLGLHLIAINHREVKDFNSQLLRMF
jgi:hypothetical protein